LFSQTDSDKNGNLSKDEVLAAFGKADQNQDGVLTKEELGAALKNAWMTAHRGSQTAHSGAAGRPPRHSFDAMLQRFDSSKSGTIKKSDVPDRVWQRLSKSDSDKNDAVTRQEFDAGRSKKADQEKKIDDKPADSQPAAEKSQPSVPQTQKDNGIDPADALQAANFQNLSSS